MDPDLFISYSHKDKDWLEVIKTHLEPYRQEGMITYWDDTAIEAGAIWFEKINRALQTAKAALFLVSSDFLASEFIREYELPVLLERADQEGISILWIVVSPCAPSHPLSKYQALHNPLKSISELSRSKRQHQLVDIALKIAHIVNQPNPPPVADRTQNIHVFTSVKGGVGKTLLSLAVVGSYFYRNLRTHNTRILAMDTNTVNMDLYNMLANDDRVGAINQKKLPWYLSEMDTPGPSCVIRKDTPYVLPLGIVEFWKDVEQMVQIFDDCDVVIDTNMHVANLMEGASDHTGVLPEKVLNRILGGATKRQLFIWNIWTFASFRDPKYVNFGISNFEAHISPQLIDRVNFIHVLNPSALVPPQSKLGEQIQSLYEIGATRKKFDEIITELPIGDPYIDVLAEIRDKIVRERMNELNFLDLDAGRTIGIFPGLEELMYDESPSDAITSQELIETVGHRISASARTSFKDIFGIIYQEEFVAKKRGRPKNLLPIFVHDPSLQGYTEDQTFYSKGNLGKLRGHLGQIQYIMDDFLVSLLRS